MGMTIMLWLLAGSALLELALHVVPGLWRARVPGAVLLVVMTAVASLGLLVVRPSLTTLLLLLVSGYRVFNDVRIIKARMHERYLRRATRRTSMMLIGMQTVIGLAFWGVAHLGKHYSAVWTVLAGAQLLIAIMLLASLVRRLRHTHPSESATYYSDHELPSITIAIPARNETEDLDACLRSIIANDYPKFEVIVLDDCSQNKRTPEIIRSFAHDGVRFVQGDPPHGAWLPKNQAYDKLSHEASGEAILFCGVDVRFEQDTIRRLVTTMITRRKNMLSVLPQRANGPGPRGALIQAMRYWWELVPPRRMFARPPVMSSCWLISTEILQRLGGFDAVQRSISPEAYFARQLIATDAYSFVRSNQLLGVTSLKSMADQRATAVRTRYPQLHRRPEQVLLTSWLEAFFLLLPFVLATLGGRWHIGTPAQLLAGASAVLLIIIYTLVGLTTALTTWWSSVLAFPLAALIDLWLLHYSMWRYEFSTVEWKDRNVCIPVMHVVPHLPGAI